MLRITVMADSRRTVRREGHPVAVVLAALVAAAATSPGAEAQDNQFGVQDRANAAQQMIVLAVQQGISSLPPTSGQSFTYTFDPALDTLVRNEHLGPTSFRTAETIGKGNVSVRLATSYFELADRLGPVDYRVDGPVTGGEPLRTRFGLQASAQVGLINLAASYGISDNIEGTINLPVVVTHATASEIFLTRPNSDEVFAVRLEPPGTIDRLLGDGSLTFRTIPFSDAGAQFNDGTHAGVGRISLATKAVVYWRQWLQLALAPELFFPSPNQAELAGSDSAAILPRAIAAVPLSGGAHLHIDVGYDFDFNHDELRRIVWNAGGSLPIQNLTLDCGVGGSRFNRGITWTPDRASFVDLNGNRGNIITALGDNQLGNTFVDFLAGIKVRLTERSVLSGAVTVPLNDEGFRAVAVGTAAVELYF